MIQKFLLKLVCENRLIFKEKEIPTDIGKAIKGLVTHKPEDTAVGLLGGKPSPPEIEIQEAKALPKNNLKAIVETTRNGVMNVLKLPTTVAGEAIDATTNISEKIVNIARGVNHQVRVVVFTLLAIPPKIWDSVTRIPSVAVEKISNGIHNSIRKVAGWLPRIKKSPPKQEGGDES